MWKEDEEVLLSPRKYSAGAMIESSANDEISQMIGYTGKLGILSELNAPPLDVPRVSDTRNLLYCDQSNYSSRIVFSYTSTVEPDTNWIG